MPFNYLACSIKGTAFPEYSSLLLITREMNSLSGGASIPNATPSTNYPDPAPGPHPRPRRAARGCGRHVSRPGSPGDPGPAPRPALAPSRPARPDRGLARPSSGGRAPPPGLPGPHRSVPELPPPAALSAPASSPRRGAGGRIRRKRNGVSGATRRRWGPGAGGSWGGAQRAGAAVKVRGLWKRPKARGAGQPGAPLRSSRPCFSPPPRLSLPLLEANFVN